MNFDWRVSAVAAGVAFVLSLIVGVIAGVAFGAILLRAFIWALLFGVGAAGLVYVVDRFIPELRQSLKQSAKDQAEQPVAGESVDIVVDEDLLGEDSPVPIAAAPDAGGDQEVLEELDAAEPDESGGSGYDPESPLAAATASESPQALAEGDAEAGAEVVGEPEELEEAPPEAGSTSSLPDIDGFSGSFEESKGTDEIIDSGESSGEDTASMARAIRTVLKREE